MHLQGQRGGDRSGTSPTLVGEHGRCGLCAVFAWVPSSSSSGFSFLPTSKFILSTGPHPFGKSLRSCADGCVLLHCEQGVNRSCALALALRSLVEGEWMKVLS